jgi:flagellar hook-associated protein 3 FlgL
VNLAKIGAITNKAEATKEAISQRKIVVIEALSGMEDADIAKLVTEMQSLIVARDAAQQTFVKISQQNLFDFLR